MTNPLEERLREIEKRFWLKVTKTKTCWLWNGYVTNKGYGGLTFKRQYYVVHRLSFELCGGEKLGERILDHICRVRNCVNPKHLRIATNRENTLAGIGPTAINSRKTHCNNGHPLSVENVVIYKTWRVCKTCKWASRHSPKYMAYMQAYIKRPERREHMRNYLRAYMRNYSRTPEQRAYKKAYMHAYARSPKQLAYQRAYNLKRKALATEALAPKPPEKEGKP